jgi:predicted nucleic acid-binding protein
MTVVDTSVWIDYFNGRATTRTDLLDRLLGTEYLLMGDLILVEVLQGFRSEHDFQRVRRHLETLELRPMVGRKIAIAEARNHRTLRTRGLTVRKSIDTLIATFRIAENHELLHCDRGFDAFERHLGLRVVKA